MNRIISEWWRIAGAAKAAGIGARLKHIAHKPMRRAAGKDLPRLRRTVRAWE